jgi:hypothetical protein
VKCGFVGETAKPSARESAGGFAFVPRTCRLGIVGLSKMVFRRCGFFTAAKCRIADAAFHWQSAYGSAKSQVDPFIAAI